MRIKIIMKKMIKLILKKIIQRQSHANISTNNYNTCKNDNNNNNIINIINEFRSGFLKRYISRL